MYGHTFLGFYLTPSEAKFIDSLLEVLSQVAIVAGIITLIVYVIVVISYCMLFKKANRPIWKAIIPIYNMVTMFKIAKIEPWLIILYFIPIVNFIAIIVLGVVQSMNIARAYGKGSGYTLGLLFFPILFYPMLAFGKSKYQI